MADVELPSGETDLSAISLSADDVLLVLEGTQTVDTGVTAHNTTDLQRVYIGPNFRGSFGTAASPVDLKVSNTTTDSDPRIEIEGGAYVNLCSSGGIDKLVSDMPPGATLALGTGASAIAVLQALGGLLNITAGALVTNLYAWGAEQVILKQHATTALTIFEAAAGLILCERSAATVKCHHDAIFRLMESAAVSTLADIRGGVFNHRSRGTVAQADLYAGTLTPEGAPKDPVITTANIYGSSATTRYIQSIGNLAFSVGTENISQQSAVYNPGKGGKGY